MNQSIETSLPDDVQSRRSSVLVRVLASLGIVFVVAFETWHAMTSVITWRDSAHYVAAIGSIGFCARVIKTGSWR